MFCRAWGGGGGGGGGGSLGSRCSVFWAQGVGFWGWLLGSLCRLMRAEGPGSSTQSRLLGVAFRLYGCSGFCAYGPKDVRPIGDVEVSVIPGSRRNGDAFRAGFQASLLRVADCVSCSGFGV